ncbi:MAG TPA: tetraacyldisaccharide 4'-kinase [Vicinamibacteria bacterium]|nr:tetraacyldisaccharide 4'-kinase [Vicinamibacteria bacterium]
MKGALLAPLAAVFAWGASARVRLYRAGVLQRRRLRGPVISVGNLSVGGSGKTPVVARVAALLRDDGLPVAILSRGHGGRFRGEALIVSDGRSVLADAETAGDEPVMLARELPGVVVAVGRRRDRVGRAVEARFGARAHVLDDGFQHLRLARDLDILCVDPADLVDRTLPAGRLRERPPAAARAGLVLTIGGGDRESERSLGLARRAVGFFDKDGVPRPAPVRPLAFAGIARPERFFEDVGALGRMRFPDHHRFSPDDLRRVAEQAVRSGADAIVTTAKDAVRLPAWSPPVPLLVFKTEAVVSDEPRFRDLVLAAGRRAAVRSRPRPALEEGAAAAFARVIGVLPRRAALGLGRGLGRFLGDLDRRHVAVALDNLAHAFPHWEPGRRLRTAREVYAHFGQVLVDLFWLAGRRREEVESLVEVEGREHVEAAMAAGRGALLVTAHIGNWELHGLAHGWTFGPIGVVARPLDNPLLDRRLCALRTAGGNAVIYKQHALAQILRTLRRGGGVAILIDQNVQEKDGIFVEFFGRPAATTTVAAAVAVKTRCALVPCHTELRRDGRYRVVYDPPLLPRPAAERGAEILRLTQELTRAIEGWVRETPSQWLWVHRRWKTRPPAAVPGAELREERSA